MGRKSVIAGRRVGSSGFLRGNINLDLLSSDCWIRFYIAGKRSQDKAFCVSNSDDEWCLLRSSRNRIYATIRCVQVFRFMCII